MSAADEEIADAELVTDEPTPTTAALVPVGVPNSPIVRPITDLATVREAFGEYEQIKNAIVVAADKMTIQGKTFITKSGWRKLAVAMGVSGELQSRDYDRDVAGRIIRAEVIVRAVAPNGRTMDGLGVCDYRERCCPKAFGPDEVCKNSASRHSHCPEGCDGFNHFSKPQHDIPATAFTRSLNRACSDLFGFGEVSAEEVTDREEPAEEADKARIFAALNGIEDADQRRGAKNAFGRQFGNPAELLKGQMDAAIKFCTANGATVPESAVSITEPPAKAEVPATDTPTPVDPGESGSDAGSVGGGPGEGVPVGSAQASSPSPETPAADVPPGPPPLRDGDDAAGAETAPAPTPPPAPPARGRRAGPSPTPQAERPSDAKQRMKLGMRCNELATAGKLAQGDKPEIVAAITNGRATSTTEMTFDEANKMIALLVYLTNGDLMMVDDPAGGRCPASVTDRGADFLRPIVGGPTEIDPAPPADGAEPESVIY